MNFIEQEEEELEEEPTITTSKLPSPSSSSTNCRNYMFETQNLWPPSSSDHQIQQDPPSKLDPMDLSLSNSSIEKEHMFDKVVTPSDVGKLNRLVIPKQHAERYFPLDSNSNEKGLLLNFEDRNGKPWRFRYSYWNSSQSYVMTKGWSRFVKEKKLDAGDIVSFQRGVGESARHQLYIDWRHRPSAPDPTSFSQFELQNQFHFPQPSVRWGRLYSLPQPFSRPPPFDHLPSQFHHNYGPIQPYHHHRHYDSHPPAPNYAAAISPQYYLRPPAVAQFGGDQAPLVIDSVPVVHGRSVGKRLRLFGVNMECSTAPDDQYAQSSGGGSPISMAESDSRKGKSKSSLSFDLDI